MNSIEAFENKVFVSKIYLPNKDNLNKYIDGIYESGWLTNNGPLVQELEKRLEEYLGVKNLLLVSNGTTGLQLAVKALGLTGEAITSPFSFASTASSLAVEGIKPVFVDIDKHTYNINPDFIEDSITENTSAIMPVHVFGNPCDIEAIDQIAEKNNLKVIYDASHTFGTIYNDKSILSYGDIAVISFHATKIYHTIEGGAVVIKDDDIYEKAKLLRNYGIDGPDSIALAGINAKMNEFEAAMGLCNLQEIDLILAERKKSYEYYLQKLQGVVQLQKWNQKGTPSYSYVSAVFETYDAMDKARTVLSALNIFPRQYFSPSLDTVDFGFGVDACMENSQHIANRIMVLPLHSNAEEIVCNVIIDSLQTQ